MSAQFDALNASRIQDAIQQFSKKELNKPYDATVSCFESIDSTNTWLLENGKEGDFCLSECQTAGRGRRDNHWVSPKSGNIYLSFCCCFDASIANRSLLGLVSGISIAEALQEIGLSGHGIKWPNDIFWRGKKLGGILIQTADNYERFVVGIGLNVHLPEDSLQEITQAATSLEEALMHKNDGVFKREDVAIKLMQQLLLHTNLFPKLSFNAFLQNWQRWDILQGQKVRFQHKNEIVTGIVDGIDEHGRMGVLLNSGREFFSAADIKLNKPTV